MHTLTSRISIHAENEQSVDALAHEKSHAYRPDSESNTAPGEGQARPGQNLFPRPGAPGAPHPYEAMAPPASTNKRDCLHVRN